MKSPREPFVAPIPFVGRDGWGQNRRWGRRRGDSRSLPNSCRSPMIVYSYGRTRLVPGRLWGIVFGILEVLITEYGNHRERTPWIVVAGPSPAALPSAVWRRDVSPRVHPVSAGALVGLLIRVPDPFGLRAHHEMLGTGLLLGALTGRAAKMPGGDGNRFRHRQ